MDTSPDWVIVGYTDHDTGRVMLVASDDLDRARMEAQQQLRRTPGGGYTAGRVRFQLTAQGGSHVQVVGEDYADAMRKLLGTWTPQPRTADEQTAIEQSPAALDPAADS